jgi:hypothetical protein
MVPHSISIALHVQKNYIWMSNFFILVFGCMVPKSWSSIVLYIWICDSIVYYVCGCIARLIFLLGSEQPYKSQP